MEIDLPKPLYWTGSAKKDFKAFPLAVQRNMGMWLYVVQLGRMPYAANPWKGLGPGVHELVDDHLGNTYRAVYVVRLGDAVHVLHAFQKKSKTGIGTPKPEIALIERRLKQVLASYTPNRSKP